MLEIIKLASLVIAALLGVYGSIFNLRKSNNKISIHGWVCISGILICAVISGTLQLQSDAKDEEKNIKLLQQNNLLLENANRNLTPLSPLIISISLRPNLKLETIIPFLSSLEKNSAKLSWGLSNSLSSFGSQSMPSPETRPDRAFLEATCSQDTSIIIFKSPTDVNNFDYSTNPDYAYDLAIEINNPCKWYYIEFTENIRNLARLNTVFVNGKILDAHAEFDPIKVSGTSSEWNGNGRIVSVMDLLNSTMILQLYNRSADAREGFTPSEVGELRRKTDLIELKIKLPNGALLVFDEDNLSKHVNKRGEPYYSFKFPDTLDDLLRMTKHDSMKLIYKAGLPKM
ncbi:hypothetical protein [Pseudomonas umsongensis]|jgi:hypothetical protein|uniref:hypothetical protein n=1 Tax=Pseudomonas umsongensis TaxID=198618 RepID=UPI0015C1299F|nr:hypothetical protein [Pseudomonas umsongensis]NWL17779.1 hypothetical protein [Pseudomonas umsongensis]